MIEISLAAIVENYNFLCSQVGSEVAVSAVIKANAYGTGAAEVCEALLKAGCSTFFLSSIPESVQLLEAYEHLRGAEIYALHGIASKEEAQLCLQYKSLFPVLNSSEQIALWAEIAPGAKCAIHFDTGMTRLGFSNPMLVLESRFFPVLNIQYILSHLASAQDMWDEKNIAQLRLFIEYRNLFPNIKASLAKSAGIFLGKDYHFDMVRPGIALYGGNPTPWQANSMKQVVKVYANIVQKCVLDKASQVGYFGTYEAAAGAKMLTVEYGYADGLMRILSNKSHVYSKVERRLYKLPIAGRISMDLMTLDATVMSEEDFAAISQIEIIGDHQTIDDVARDANTTSYEVLVNLSKRHKRIYKYKDR